MQFFHSSRINQIKAVYTVILVYALLQVVYKEMYSLSDFELCLGKVLSHSVL
jgi:hypothetical protein